LVLDLLNLCGAVLLFAYLLRKLREYSRRHIFGRKRARELQAAFPAFCYVLFPAPRDTPALASFPNFAEIFELSINQRLLGGRPEMYNMIKDQRGTLRRSVFDLRTVSQGYSGGAGYSETNSVFMISLSDKILTPFQINRHSFGYTSLWGGDLVIDIDDEFFLAKSLSLAGPDREAIIKIFDTALVNFFRTHSRLFTFGALEVTPNGVIFLHARACSSKDIQSTLDALTTLTELLSR
jgi:hypothetical protein